MGTAFALATLHVVASAPVRLLALGDSYTIGHNVQAQDRWPSLLAQAFRLSGIDFAEPEIIARTGWTTRELQQAVEQSAPAMNFDIVTVLVGVNDQYRHGTAEAYGLEFKRLLSRAITLTGGRADRVIVLSIPDWGVTPFAAGGDREKISSEIDGFNRANREAARALGVRYVDVTTTSRRAIAEPHLIARDGLHPSRDMYRAWVELIRDEVKQALGRRLR